MGACGRSGSRPLLGGSGSRGKPLQRSFRRDMVLVVVLDVDSNRHDGLEDFKNRETLSLAAWWSLPFRTDQWETRRQIIDLLSTCCGGQTE